MMLSKEDEELLDDIFGSSNKTINETKVNTMKRIEYDYYGEYLDNLVYLMIKDDNFFYEVIKSIYPNDIVDVNFRMLVGEIKDFYLQFGRKPDKATLFNIMKLKNYDGFDIEAFEAIWKKATEEEMDKDLEANIRDTWKYVNLLAEIARLGNYIHNSLFGGFNAVTMKNVPNIADDVIERFNNVIEARKKIETPNNDDWD